VAPILIRPARPARAAISIHVRAALAMLLVVLVAASGCTSSPTGASSKPVRILAGAPGTFDPAAASDAGTAAVLVQLFESLVTFDATLTARPALAASWDVLDEGRRIVFHLRPNLTFSDGTALTAADVVRSWLRLIDPERPSPLASLMFDVEGALPYLRGDVRDASTVGLVADGNDVTVDLVRPAADFVNIVAGPSFGIVPPGIDDDPQTIAPGTFVASGGYAVSAVTSTGTTLAANERYWAGTPPVGTIELVHDLGGRSAVAVYEAGELDLAPIGDFDASWIAYDETLGPDLREVPSLSVQYYGFTTDRPPFDDVRVRRAFGLAVDWRRVVELGSIGSTTVATSMVPLGIPGRSEEDFLPPHDPDEARRLLAEAGYPGGRDFPEVTFMTSGGAYDEAIVSEIERELGISVRYENLFDTYFDRLQAEPPGIWSLGWVADYPGPNDFLGVLLGSDSTNNYGRWRSPPFDAAIAEAGAATDPAIARAAYDRAEGIVRDEVPVIPVSYDTGWMLARPGLLGAGQNGLGLIRMAGLEWAS
jgi:oligopeptide transport system substrate-binding protein